jgi:peptide/nickel transport system ATP-binding protein
VTAPLLTVDGLSKIFAVTEPLVARLVARAPRRAIRAVDDVGFTIAAGRSLGLVGESGCGKSTVARCVAGLTAPSAGTIRFRGATIQDIAAGRAPYRREIQMIFQDPYGSLNPRWRVGRIVADPLHALKLARGRGEIADNVARLLEAVGLSAADATRYPHEFSGGQRQRIAVARALASRPSLVVCDEPTSALDVSVQAQILNLMRDLQDAHGLAFLFISHNLAVVDHMCDDVAVMYLGRIVEAAPRDAIFGRPMHPYTRLLLAAVPTLDRIGEPPRPMHGEVPDPAAPPAGCAFHPRCPFATDLCRRERPVARRLGPGLVACHRAEDVADAPIPTR